MQNADTSEYTVKNEPVFAVEMANLRMCFRCGRQFHHRSSDDVKNSQAIHYNSDLCEMVGHMEICCNENFPQRHDEMVHNVVKAKTNVNQMRKINYN